MAVVAFGACALKTRAKLFPAGDQSPGGRWIRREIRALRKVQKQHGKVFGASARCAKCARLIAAGEVFLQPHPAATVEQPLHVRVCFECVDAEQEEEDSTP